MIETRGGWDQLAKRPVGWYLHWSVCPKLGTGLTMYRFDILCSGELSWGLASPSDATQAYSIAHNLEVDAGELCRMCASLSGHPLGDVISLAQLWPALTTVLEEQRPGFQAPTWITMQSAIKLYLFLTCLELRTERQIRSHIRTLRQKVSEQKINAQISPSVPCAVGVLWILITDPVTLMLEDSGRLVAVTRILRAIKQLPSELQGQVSSLIDQKVLGTTEVQESMASWSVEVVRKLEVDLLDYFQTL